MKVGVVRQLLLLLYFASSAGALSAGGPSLRRVERSDRFRLRPPAQEPAAVLGGRDGVVMTRAAEADLKLAEAMLGGDGGGADVADFALLQVLYLDSGCPFPTPCGGPCNMVLLLWTENTQNPAGVDVFLDGNRLGTVTGLPADQLPGVNGVNIVRVPAGAHTFRASAVNDMSSAEASIEVLASQPFDDAAGLACRQGAVAGDGTCEIVATWANADPPDTYALLLDGVLVATLLGTATQATIFRAQPGNHCVTLLGFSNGAGNDYRGCAVESCCDITCVAAEACNPPSALLACQVAYGTQDGGNDVLLGWVNGEHPYGVALNVFLDGQPAGSLPTDSMTGSPASALFEDLPAGLHAFGVQGDCGPPDGASSIATTSLDVLTQTPHPNPVQGDVLCTWSPDGGGTTAVTWTNADPSSLIQVYVEVPGGLVRVGFLPGTAMSVEVGGTLATDVIVLQFFVNLGGECYGSELFRCVTPPGRNRFIRGLCDGVGARPLISSAIFLFNFLFLGGPRPPCVAACNSNGDGALDISDGSHILNFLFLGGPAPAGWTDSSGDGRPDPTCQEAPAGADCAMRHQACSA